MAERILYLVNDLDFFVSHRLPLALAARARGYDVLVAAPDGPARSVLEAEGLKFLPLALKRRQNNPFLELAALAQIFQVYRSHRPDLVHLITIKPILYGILVGYLFPRMRLVAAVSGLGPAFRGSHSSGLVGLIVRALYRLAFRHKRLRVIFQNPDDRAILMGITGLPPQRSFMIRGSGVDLAQYQETPEPAGRPCVLMASRLLKDKGVPEFVAAASMLVQDGLAADYVIAGMSDQNSPGSVTAQEIETWQNEGAVRFLGHRDDMPRLISRCHLVVLPSSYGEGIPKILIEAAACGRAVVTTDHPGCRDAIEPGVTGVLVPLKDPESLARAIRRLIEDSAARTSMGQAGRQLAERFYSIESVVDQHLAIYQESLKA